MANPPKPWKVEYAKTGRSSCKTCRSRIRQDQLRLGKMLKATRFDGFMPSWNHANCVLKKPKRMRLISPGDVEGIELLRWEDQEKIRKSWPQSNPDSPPLIEYRIENSQTSRATCKFCNQKITKEQLRISSKPKKKGAKVSAWHHANCFIEQSPATELDKILGWENIPSADQTVLAQIKKPTSCKINGTKDEVQDDKDSVQPSASKDGGKRKNALPSHQKSKIAKIDGSTASNMGDDLANSSNLENQLEAQTKRLWALKDDIKNHVPRTDLRATLVANNQDSTGSESDLRDRCVDGMLFGALSRCPLCTGCLHYSGGTYKCGAYTQWSKCAYITTEPEREKGKWKIPEETRNQFLITWFNSQNSSKPIRILPPPSSSAGLGAQSPSTSDKLAHLRVAIAGVPQHLMDEWKMNIEAVGGQVHHKIQKNTNTLVVSKTLDQRHGEMWKARRRKLPIVTEEYLVDCIKSQKKLPYDLYRVESKFNVKVKGVKAVNVITGLPDFGHILEDGKSVYNTTMNMSDLSTGINSYYILQIIQVNYGPICYVFRKWGRLGNEEIGGSKFDEMPKSEAIQEFKRLFLRKTGNSWETWEQKKDFQKRPGKFFPLEIDLGNNEEMRDKKTTNGTVSKLSPALADLMRMLFNVETYRSTMMEYKINMAKMPLGNLSKSNIQKGFEALTEIQNLFSSNAHSPAVKESLIIDASNRFFTVIPSLNPHVIRDENDFKSKVKMLEALEDIEIASRFAGFDADNDDSLDEKYEKLHCNMVSLPHDSEDYQMIKKYLQTTHGPTHTEWTLALEEVFAVEREGEFYEFAPYKKKLKNKMLLWHGSRLTNFVSILSQGLRVAPPEAPSSGYTFGKGIYFADMASKSSLFCCTDKKNPVGLMLLSEVALGEVYELRRAEYMNKPPEGKHSTKGLGKIIPYESEYVKWRDDVVVPCGKPVSSNVKSSDLMYNEYIVYNKAQVKMQFLLKVSFHHKQ